MVNLKTIKEQIITDVTKIVARRFNAKESEVKVSFASDGNLKVSIVPEDLSFINVCVEVGEI